MIILESTISHVLRNRDFGRIEARVTFLAKTQTGQPPHRLSVLTNVPMRGHNNLRERLTSSAVGLAQSLSQHTARAGTIAA